MTVLRLKTENITLGQAIRIVKYDLEDQLVHPRTKILALRQVAEMETHNSVTKDELVAALRWVFERYSFPEE